MKRYRIPDREILDPRKSPMYPLDSWEKFFSLFFSEWEGGHLQRYQVDDPHGWQVLYDWPDLRIIHLRRLNLVDQYASWRLGVHTNNFHSREYDPSTIELDWDHEYFLEVAAEWDRIRQYTTDLFQDLPGLHLTYEELEADFGGTMYRCQQFLGTDPIPLEPALEKLPPVDYSRIFNGYLEDLAGPKHQDS